MNKYHYEWLNGWNKTRPTLMCLHGFTGTLHTFDCLRDVTDYNILGIDLIGHGKTQSVEPTDYSMLQVVKELVALKQHLLPEEKVAVLGYSMGARVALAFAMSHPEMIEKLILESGSPGLKTVEEQETRRKHDAKLAERLQTRPLVEFIDFWQELPLFQTQKALPQATQQKVRQERLTQDPLMLAYSLLYMGTGSQIEYWSTLQTLQVPTLYLAGTKDQKFCQIGQEMSTIAPNIIYQELHAGHCIHLEQPDAFCQRIENFLESR